MEVAKDPIPTYQQNTEEGFQNSPQLSLQQSLEYADLSPQRLWEYPICIICLASIDLILWLPVIAFTKVSSTHVSTGFLPILITAVGVGVGILGVIIACKMVWITFNRSKSNLNIGLLRKYWKLYSYGQLLLFVLGLVAVLLLRQALPEKSIAESDMKLFYVAAVSAACTPFCIRSLILCCHYLTRYQ